MKRRGSLDETVDYWQSMTLESQYSWPTVNDWLKVVAISVLVAVILDSGIDISNVTTKAGEFASQLISRIHEYAAVATDIQSTAKNQSTQNDALLSKTGRPCSKSRCTVLIYRVVPGSSKGCH